MVISIRIVSGRTFSNYHNDYKTCQIESGVVGSDPLSPVKCTIDISRDRFVITNVYKFTTSPLKIMYYAQTASDHQNF